MWVYTALFNHQIKKLSRRLALTKSLLSLWIHFPCYNLPYSLPTMMWAESSLLFTVRHCTQRCFWLSHSSEQADCGNGLLVSRCLSPNHPELTEVARLKGQWNWPPYSTETAVHGAVHGAKGTPVSVQWQLSSTAKTCSVFIKQKCAISQVSWKQQSTVHLWLWEPRVHIDQMNINQIVQYLYFMILYLICL